VDTASLILVGIIVVVGLGFDFTNGFHDAANAIATSISTRALTPRVALVMSAVLNLVGALASTKVASTIGNGIIATPTGVGGLTVVLGALAGAIIWNLITWYFGLPSSSTHALIGGLVGAALASAGSVKWLGLADKVVVPMVASPLIGLCLGYLVMIGILWAFRNTAPGRTGTWFRRVQTVSAAALSFSHGNQDAQKTMGVITLALVTSGHLASFHVPLWVILASATAMGLGTYAAGWRIIRTLGRRIVHLDPPHGFAVEASSTAVLLTSAYLYALPVSTTHVVTSTVMGVGATRRLRAVRWGVAYNIVAAWLLTIPAAAVVAGIITLIIRAIVL
jgi:PiT family inorganic phosphate transporter